MSKKAIKIIAIVLSVISILGIFLPVFSSAAGYLGDFNQDGKVTSSDARSILRISAMLDECPDELFSIADINGDGKISASDARITLRTAAMLEDLIEVELPEIPSKPGIEEESKEDMSEGPAEEPVTKEPITEEPSTDEPVIEEPTTKEPVTETKEKNIFKVGDPLPENSLTMNGIESDILGGFLVNGNMIKLDEYIYTYSDGEWSVRVADKTKTKYKEMYDEVLGYDVTNLKNCFAECNSLLEAPYVSVNAKNLEYAFGGCSKMRKAPVIPQGVINMQSAFMWCYTITEMPELPEGVTNITQAFFHCYGLTKTTKLPSTITEMERCFGYSKITNIGDIPAGVKSIEETFFYCEALKEVPVLPEGLENMNSAFVNCSSLTEMPEIPSTVKYMNSTFKLCDNLKIGIMIIPEKVESIDDCFVGIKDMNGEIIFLTKHPLNTAGFEETEDKLTIQASGQAYTSIVNNCANNSNITVIPLTVLN